MLDQDEEEIEEAVASLAGLRDFTDEDKALEELASVARLMQEKGVGQSNDAFKEIINDMANATDRESFKKVVKKHGPSMRKQIEEERLKAAVLGAQELISKPNADLKASWLDYELARKVAKLQSIEEMNRFLEVHSEDIERLEAAQKLGILK